MKHIALIALSAGLLLTSCGADTDTTPLPLPPKAPVQTSTGGVVASGSMVSVDYTLTVDGKVIETSLESKAKELGIYSTGSTYKPLEFIVEQGGMIPGFEKEVLGMKVGEKKSFAVAPENGYGTGGKTEVVQRAQIAPTFEITQDRSRLEDTVTEKISIDQLGAEGSGLVIGKKISGSNGATAEVMAIEGSGVTLKIDNVVNPFYKKNRKVGATAEQAPYTYTIKSMNDKEVVLTVANSQSPFTGKEFAVGSEATTPSGTIKIVSIGDKEVTIDFTHPLAGKTLNFDVEIKDVR